MADTRKSPRADSLPSHVCGILKQHVQRGQRVVVGLSGGVDSVVLVDVLHQASKKFRFELFALHVNHQINPAASRWAAFCRRLCAKRRIKCIVVRVTVPRDDSREAAARAVRYRAFTQVPADFIALAHNLDDQAETVFLQLLRGAGVKGLSAMPEVRMQDVGIRDQAPAVNKKNPKQAASANAESQIVHPAILRPLLAIPRIEILAYARHRNLKWIEDDSNADLSFDRNFLRHRVLPIVGERYPSYRKVIARASRHIAEASELLDELGAGDAELTENGLSLRGLRRLSAARAKNAVRYFLASRGVTMPNTARLDECVRQILHASASARITLDLGTYSLIQYAAELRLVAKTVVLYPLHAYPWRGEASLPLRELGGILKMKKCRSMGISLERLLAAPVTVRVRQGGERFRPDANRPRRSLKNLWQEARIPPWLRARTPLLFSGATLVYVPGIGIDAQYLANRGESGVEPGWQAL